MKRGRRVSSSVMEVVMLTHLLGGSCLLQPQLLFQREQQQRSILPAATACNGHRTSTSTSSTSSSSTSRRVCASRCTTSVRLQRSQLSFAWAGDTHLHDTATTASSIQGFVQGALNLNSPHCQLRTTTTACCSTSGSSSSNNNVDGGSDRRPAATDEADQETWAGERNGAPAAGGEGMVGSPEFVGLVKAQFGVLVSVLGVDRVVLFARRENAETGELEFVPAIEYPEGSTLVWSADGGPGSEVLLPPEAETAEQTMRAEDWDNPGAAESSDGGLSAPIVYASLVLGMVTVFREETGAAAVSGAGGDVLEEGHARAGRVSVGDSPGEDEGAEPAAAWGERDKVLLETVASSVAMGAVLDQKQKWAAVMQVEPLRKVVAEALHQVKNPMTALRTFGKLLLRRLPQDDTLNRELAKDIILQSDRLVDILLPVDAVLGLLANAVEREREAQMPGMVDPHLAHREGFAAAAAAASAAAAATASAGGVGAAAAARRGKMAVSEDVPQGVQDALLSPPAGLEESLPWEEPAHFGVLSVEDVIQPVSRAAQVAAKKRRVGFRWRVDDDLPKVIGDERALEEALSNVVENALKFCKMGHGGGAKDGGDRATVVLRARFSTEAEWGGAGSGVVIEVVDNGPGIEEEDLPYIFDRGYRGRRPLQCEIPGTGLGLGIARDTIRSFGGDLEVKNKAKEGGGWGTGVKLYLPRDRREAVGE
eukprot:g6679.t1